MMDRKALALVAGITSLSLTGCTLSEFLIDEQTIFGVPTGQRTAAGDSPGSTTKKTGGGSGGGGSGGGGGSDIGETGKNPASVAFKAPLNVTGLYPTPSVVSVKVIQAPNGVLALAEPRLKPSAALSVEWTGQNGFQAFEGYQTLAQASPPANPASFKLELRQRLPHLNPGTPSAPRFQVSGSTPRRLTENPASVRVLSTPINVIRKALETTGEPQKKFAILLDERDWEIFHGHQGEKLLGEIVNEIKTQIYPKNRQLFGDDPSPAEATNYGLQIDHDITYFVISRQVNAHQDRKGVLGFFYMADLLPTQYLPPGEYSNQAKIVYLSANHVRAARDNDAALYDVFGTIAHELQHLQFAWARVKAVGLAGRSLENSTLADAWIDEGLAMFAAAANGYAPQNKSASNQLSGHVANFLDEAPAYSLTTFFAKSPTAPWGNPTTSDAYGMAYLFTQYLVDQYSPEPYNYAENKIIEKILSSKNNRLNNQLPLSESNINPTGIVADAVSQVGGNLAVLFGNFSAALALDGTDALDRADQETRRLYDISGINLREIRKGGPKGITDPNFQPRPFGVGHFKPSGLSLSSSTLRLTGGSGLSGRLILHQ